MERKFVQFYYVPSMEERRALFQTGYDYLFYFQRRFVVGIWNFTRSSWLIPLGLLFKYIYIYMGFIRKKMFREISKEKLKKMASAILIICYYLLGWPTVEIYLKFIFQGKFAVEW